MNIRREGLSYHIGTSPQKVKREIKAIQDNIKNAGVNVGGTLDWGLASLITTQKKILNYLTKLRNKQKNYTPPPRKVKLKGL